MYVCMYVCVCVCVCVYMHTHYVYDLVKTTMSKLPIAKSTMDFSKVMPPVTTFSECSFLKL